MHIPGHYGGEDNVGEWQSPYGDNSYLYEYLVPLLQDTIDVGGVDQNVIYSPDVFLGQYGQYITRYDPSEELTTRKQDKLLSSTTILNSLDQIRQIDAVKGSTGFAGSGNLSSKIGTSMDSLINTLIKGDIQGLHATKSALKRHEQALYSELGTLAMLDAFTQNDEGNQALIPYWTGDSTEWESGGYHPNYDEYEQWVDEAFWEDLEEDTGGG